MDENFTLPDNIHNLLIASGQGLDSLTQNLADLLKLQVVVTSSAYIPIAQSFSGPEIDCLQVMTNESGINQDALFLCRISSPSFQAEALGRAVAPAGKIIGYIFVLFNQEQLNPESYQTIMDYAASFYAVHLQNRLEVKQEQVKAKNAFLYDILYGNLKQRDEIVSMSEIWGWNFHQPHAVLIIALAGLEDISRSWHLIDILARTVETTYSERYYKNPLTLLKRNELITIVPLTAKSPADQKKELLSFVDKIRLKLENNRFANEISCGAGQAYEEPTHLFRSYQEAKVALVMGSLLGIAVPFFRDLGLERILYKHDLQDLKEYYLHVLGELHKQDDPEGSLINTLESFADNQFDIQKTSQAIYMHRNTLRYRLNKIETILGKSLNEIEVRLDIVAAIKIKRLHKMDQIIMKS